MTFPWHFSDPYKRQQTALIALLGLWSNLIFFFFFDDEINPGLCLRLENITYIPLSLFCQSACAAPFPRRLSDSSLCLSARQKGNPHTCAAGPRGRADKHLLTSLCLFLPLCFSPLHVPGAIVGPGAARDAAAPPVRAAEGRSGILLWITAAIHQRLVTLIKAH